ncbi:unnamed protein product [Eruca vesicaria subsp. sativa]|uniref:Transmembrane protein n=1 Tax=Eruca vesicaria subsp. sativa TaxID=29727 RepID=A0ABC8JC01_ERUVS|nr:unnamed protein product [Eruca vesicaria subsp. sativa]
MEENPHRVSRRNDVGTHCQNDAVEEESRRQRHAHVDEGRCSGKRCRSWAAAAIADCVALCCCPCAIINFLTLTFVKVPWMIGRRCLGRSRKKKKNKNKNKRRLHKRPRRGKINVETAEGDDDDDHHHRYVVERDGSLTKEEEEEKTTSVRGDEESRTSARIEAERVWLELYQIGHLGFGRVSFTEIQ